MLPEKVSCCVRYRASIAERSLKTFFENFETPSFSFAKVDTNNMSFNSCVCPIVLFKLKHRRIGTSNADLDGLCDRSLQGAVKRASTQPHCYIR